MKKRKFTEIEEQTEKQFEYCQKKQESRRKTKKELGKQWEKQIGGIEDTLDQPRKQSKN